ncbi:hypothetical protein PR202_ga09473 [Eleusine coracana subsp. coracana]|uniref:GTD-binding domain-containing protein n=1 Tax=Eleusine coracana subsp. coracana TaxID=191504 RepID=A0AAV5C5B4_ELECO|nr:hypothetical protein PR202_ga09473 [Eleusine coracana subsp. coracana]
MGTRMPAVLRRVSSVLSTALLEWILMLLLFIDAVYSFLVTRFARLCKLPAPCPFCSRLDHVLGNEQPSFYRELICKTHKSEISSLAFCRLHQKLAGVKSMCERCCEKANDNEETNEPVMDVRAFDSSQGDGDMVNSLRTRICSCCGQHFKHPSVTLSYRKITELQPTELTSDSDIEVPCADDGKSSHPREASAMEEDVPEDATFELPDIPFPEVVKESERYVQKELSVTDHHATSVANNVVGDHSDSKIHEDQIEAKDNVSVNPASHYDPVLVLEDSLFKDVDVSQCPVASSREFPQNPHETEPCQSTTEDNEIPQTYQFTILEEHYVVSCERNIKDDLEQILGPEITSRSSNGFHQRITSANDPGTEMAPQNTDRVTSKDSYLKGAHSENNGEVKGHTKKFEPTCDMATHDMKMQDPSDYVEEACLSADDVRSRGEVPQDHSAAEDYPRSSESTVERRPPLSTQISMNEAYRLAIGSKSSLPSPTLTDVILGKDSTSSVNEELRLLLSQLSASRGLEAPWVDPGPSPRAYVRGDELVVQNITNRISLERNASGLESLEESIVSEMEGESTIDRLRRQIDLDRKSIHLLCRELEEERNASAIAASQALAMITKLQDEKAAMQMEASHYQRMMEEQAEYDGEALAKANELLAEREQQIEELETELENCRQQFGTGHFRFEQENTNAGLVEEGNHDVPMINTPRGSNSLVSFEDERAYIEQCLTKLEQKLQSYSNNSTSADVLSSDTLEDDLSRKVSTAEDDSLDHQGSKEEGSSTISWEVNLTKVQEEIATLNRRLKTLEGDRNFLEHSINSLRNGNEGLMFIQEIARNLRELRAIAIDKK